MHQHDLVSTAAVQHFLVFKITIVARASLGGRAKVPNEMTTPLVEQRRETKVVTCQSGADARGICGRRTVSDVWSREYQLTRTYNRGDVCFKNSVFISSIHSESSMKQMLNKRYAYTESLRNHFATHCKVR